MYKSHANVSHGGVSTRVKCGGTFNDDFITDLLPNFTVKEFRKSVTIWRNTDKSKQ